MRYLNKREAWMFLLILPAVLPAGLIYYLNISHIVMYLKIVVMVLLLLEYCQRRIPIDNYLMLVSVYLLILLFSTYLYGGDLSKYFTVFLNVFYPVLWCRLSFEENRVDGIMHKLSKFLFLTALIDDVVWLLFPNGIVVTQTGELTTGMGLISNDNSLTPYLIAGCMLTLFSNVRNKEDSLMKDIATLVVFTFAMYYVFTGVGIIVSLICSVLLLTFKYSSTLKNILNFKRIVFIVVVLFVVFCIFRATNWISTFSIALGSSVTFSGRTKLWEYAKTLIATHPILGYGVQKDVYMRGYSYRTTPHNMYFQMLIWSGIIGTFPLIGILILAIRKVSFYWKERKDIRVLSLGVIGVLIYFLFEVHTSVQLLWMVLSYILYYDLFENAEID